MEGITGGQTGIAEAESRVSRGAHIARVGGPGELEAPVARVDGERAGGGELGRVEVEALDTDLVAGGGAGGGELQLAAGGDPPDVGIKADGPDIGGGGGDLRRAVGGIGGWRSGSGGVFGSGGGLGGLGRGWG